MHYLFDNGGVTDGLLGRFGDYRFRQHGRRSPREAKGRVFRRLLWI